ncbi:MAG: 50S ribosomal protein L18 [Alphaproteobacteria bacterium]|nr:50S ribosomal protein L18 [Alphaproteobacteria bacterium]
MKSTKQLFERRKQRVRYRLKQKAGNTPRLSVFRSAQHIYAQVIDDVNGSTVASASTVESELKSKLKSSSNKDAATEVGKLVAKRAIDAGVEKVVFDKGGYRYHGRVKSLADAAREAGLTL